MKKQELAAGARRWDALESGGLLTDALRESSKTGRVTIL